MTVTRRRILQGGLAAAASLGLQGIPGLSALEAFAQARPDLAVCAGDTVKGVRKAVDALGGMKRFVSKNDLVVIKPNMSFGTPPERGSNTDPRVVAEVARMCLEAGAKSIRIIDHPLTTIKSALENSGVKAACASLDDTFVYMIRSGKFFAEVPVPKGEDLKKTDVARDVLESDVLINIPTAKSHGGSTVSMGMKNLMGLIHNRRPFHLLMSLHEAIADLSTVIRPKLTILDATRILSTGGPGGPGDLVHRNTVIAGIDPVAIDAFGVTLSTWYGKKFEPGDIKHIAAAHRRGLGVIDLNRLTIKKMQV